MTTTEIAVVLPSAPQSMTIVLSGTSPAGGDTSLDFSDADNSQYIALLEDI